VDRQRNDNLGRNYSCRVGQRREILCAISPTAYAYTDRNGDSYFYAYISPDRYTDIYSDTNSYCNCDSHIHTYRNTHGYGNCNCHRNAYSYTHTDANTHTYANAHTYTADYAR